jgi:peroxiredoxin
MKSIDLKKKDYTLVKKYIWLYLALFAVVIFTYLDHFNEEPLAGEQLRAGETVKTTQKLVGNNVGNSAPDFSLKNLNGKRDGLSNYKGQVVVLNVWATWCGPCRIEMPFLESLYRRFRSEGFAVLAVSIDKGSDKAVKSFVDEYQLSFPVLLDTDEQVERLYPAFSVPVTYVIDKAGLVVARVDGAKNWSSQETIDSIEYLLKRG